MASLSSNRGESKQSIGFNSQVVTVLRPVDVLDAALRAHQSPSVTVSPFVTTNTQAGLSRSSHRN